MTERSWLWDGTTAGDATLAPYTRLRFNRWFGGPYSNSNNTRVHVIPGYLDNLFVRALAGTLNVLTVQAGAALVGDFLYINDASTYLTIPSNVLSTTKRVDIVALRIDNTPGSPTERTVRIVHIKGFETLYTEATLVPLLSQDVNGYWEVELARIFVNSNNFVLKQKHISSQVGYVPVFDQFAPAENLVINPEFLVPDYDSGTTEYLGSWIFTPAGAATITPTTGIGTATRSRCASIVNADVNDALTQNIAFKRDDKLGKHFFVVDALVQPQQNNGKIIIRINALSDTQTTYQAELSHEIGIFGEPTAVTKRVLEVIDFDDADADNPLVSLNLKIVNDGAAGDDFKVGPVHLSRGFLSGGQRSKHEVVFFEQQITDANWFASVKSSGTTVIDLVADYSAVIPGRTKALLLSVACKDTGSAASANCGLDVYSYDGVASTKQGGIDLSGVTNDKYRRGQIIVPIMDYWKNGSIANRRLQFVVRATGVGTLEATIEIDGLIL